MKLTTRGRYAVMAMVDLAEHGGEEPVCIGDIAERQNLSVAYLERLFAALRRAELLSAGRGRCGGYALTRPADQISVAAVMAALDEDMDATRCGGQAACTGNGERCRTHGLWMALSEQVQGFLADVSLDDVVAGRLDVRESVVTFAA